MKSNTKTYFLLAVVLVIWSTIGYRMFSSLSSESQKSNTIEVVNFKPLRIKEKDTFSLMANYQDPFLKALAKKSKKKLKKTSKPYKATEPEIDIKYTGLVTDQKTNKKVFFVSINGQQHIMSLKQEIEKVKLLGGNAIAINIRYNGKIKTIELQQ